MEKRWMAMSKSHSLHILSGSHPTLPFSSCPTFSLCFPSSHFSRSLCFPLSVAYSEAMERSCKCLLLLIQVSHPLPVEKEGDGQAEPLDESLSESLNLLSLLSLLLATIFLPCQSATDCSFYRSIHTYKHTTYERVCSKAPLVCFAFSEDMHHHIKTNVTKNK